MIDVRICNLLKLLIDNSEYLFEKKMNAGGFAAEIEVPKSSIYEVTRLQREPSKTVVKKTHEKFGINLLDELLLAGIEKNPGNVLVDLKYMCDFSRSGNSRKDSGQLQQENTSLNAVITVLKSEISALKKENEFQKSELSEWKSQAKLLRELLESRPDHPHK